MRFPLTDETKTIQTRAALRMKREAYYDGTNVNLANPDQFTLVRKLSVFDCTQSQPLYAFFPFFITIFLFCPPAHLRLLLLGRSWAGAARIAV